MKKLVCAITIIAAWTSVSAQIPVTDGANLANSISSQVENIAKYTQQLQQMKLQVEEAKRMYSQLNGLRDVGGLMNDKLLRQSLPPEYQQAVNALMTNKGGALSGISGSLKDISKQYQAQSCDQYASTAVQKECRATWQTHSMNQYVGQAGYDNATKNIDDLQQFVNAIKTSSDPKSLQDLQARISVEQVKLENEKMKLDAVAAMKKTQEEMRRQNAIDNTIKGLKPGMIRF
jgi:type IV secretion system protein VirB5